MQVEVRERERKREEALQIQWMRQNVSRDQMLLKFPAVLAFEYRKHTSEVERKAQDRLTDQHQGQSFMQKGKATWVQNAHTHKAKQSKWTH